MAAKRSVWEDIDPVKVFPSKRWGKLAVVRVQRRSTNYSRQRGTFYERVQLECKCGKKFWVDSSESAPRDCGKSCKLRSAGPTPEEILAAYIPKYRTGSGDGWGIETTDKELTEVARRVIRAAKKHGWKV